MASFKKRPLERADDGLGPEPPEDNALYRRMGEVQAKGSLQVLSPQVHVSLPHVHFRHPDGQAGFGQQVQLQLQQGADIAA